MWQGVTEGGTYRYGFNSQERDIELGESVYTAEFWQYSANLGRRWNVDPITFPNISPYPTLNNNPIIFTERLFLNQYQIYPFLWFYRSLRFKPRFRLKK